MTRTEMCYDGALVMPSNYAVVNEAEMTYVEGGGIIAWTFATTGGIAAFIAGALAGAVAGGCFGTITLPVIGTVSMAAVGAAMGGIAAFSAGFMTAYEFGRFLEKKFFGWY